MDETIRRTLVAELNTQTAQKRLDTEYYVEGYASTFDKYELTRTKDGQAIMEQFSRNAFDGADMSDVILQFDHEGPVFARTSNGTLHLDVDDHGLFIYADLSKTSRSKALYEDIQAGNITKMSLRCSVDQDFDMDSMTNNVTRVKKLYDVSAVSLPANSGTEIVARNAEQALAKAKEDEIVKQKIELLMKLGGI